MKQVGLFILKMIVFVQLAHAQSALKTVFIIVDGIPASVIEKTNLPAFNKIAKEGTYVRAYVGGERGGYSQTPTISAVGYNSLLTGVWANKHNVWSNYGKNIDSINYHYWNVFRMFKAQYPEKKTAIYSTWIDNRIKLLGKEAAPDIFYDGLELDTLQFPHQKDSRHIQIIDDFVVRKAAASIKQDAPDLAWVYLQYTDDVAHRYGIGDSLVKAVQHMDKQIENIWEAIEYRKKNYQEDWQVWITTDHGRDSSGLHHGGQSEGERSTWIITNKKINKYFKKRKPAIVDILPSIVHFFGINIETNQQRELDGISLLKTPAIDQAKAELNNNHIFVEWKPINKKGEVKVWLARSNHFKSGGIDDYQLLASVPVKKGKFSINTDNLTASFYKIVLESNGTFLNRWILKESIK